MKQAITYNAAAGMGIKDVVTYSWNGNEFTTNAVFYFEESQIADQYNKALANIPEAIQMWPEEYNFGIKAKA